MSETLNTVDNMEEVNEGSNVVTKNAKLVKKLTPLKVALLRLLTLTPIPWKVQRAPRTLVQAHRVL